MKRNILYFLLLIAIGVICYFVFFGKKKKLFSKSDANFQVENVEDVTKIFLSSNDGRSIRLQKKSETEWTLNDSMVARPDWVRLLLDGFEHQNASAPVPESMHDVVVKDLAGNSVKCEIFKGDKKTNQFYVSREPGKENITYMLNIDEDGNNASRPYLVKYGLGNTFLGVRYEPEMSTWRDRKILFYPKSESYSISVNYPDSSQHNFRIEVPEGLKTDDYIVTGSIKNEGELNVKRAKDYVKFYESLYCVGYENDYGLKDTFLKAFSPLAQIEVKNIQGQSKELDIYYRPVYKGTNKILNVKGKQFDGDSFFGWLNNKDFVLLSRKTVTQVLQSNQDFFSKN